MPYTIAERTHIGHVRSLNQDSHFVRRTEQGIFLCVADGLGGHPCGERVSRLVTDLFEARMATFFSDPDPRQVLQKALRDSQQQINRYTDQHPDCRNMGTTLVCARVQNDQFFTAHIGDSRAYLIRAGSVRSRTEDHTLVQRLIQQGELPAESLYFHPYRHVLDRIVGGARDNRPSFDFSTDRELRTGDHLLLCSDGLYGMVPESQIVKIISQSDPDPETKCDQLLSAALQNGGKDNITLILLQAAGPTPQDHLLEYPEK